MLLKVKKLKLWNKVKIDGILLVNKTTIETRIIKEERNSLVVFRRCFIRWYTEWFQSTNTADDMLQDSFNIVLKKLLSENIFRIAPRDGDSGIDLKAPLPETNTITPGAVNNKNAYIINNAVPMIYPQQKKESDERFGFLNLDGRQSKNAQFCPVTSIADSQPLCSIGVKKTRILTEERSVNYSMDMGLEVETDDTIYGHIM